MQQVRKLAVVVGLALLPAVAGADVYRCAGNVFQAVPCENGKTEIVNGTLSVMNSSSIKAASRGLRRNDLRQRQAELQQQIQRLKAASTPSASSSSSSYQQSLEARNNRVKARVRGSVPTGSTVSQAEAALGRPDKRNNYTVGGKTCERMYWYDRDGRIEDYATACGGKVDYHSQQ